MTDPYTEANRQMPRGRVSPLAKLFMVFGGLAALVLVGLFIFALVMFKRVSEAVEEIADADSTVEKVARAVELAGSDISVVATNEETGTVTIRSDHSGEYTVVDLSEMGGVFQDRSENVVHVDGEADERGGVVRIRTSEGETKLELRREGEGGFFRITSPNGALHVGATDGADDLPGWVPVYPGATREKMLFSSRSDSRAMGVAVLATDAEARDIRDWYAETLTRAGFTVSDAVVKDNDLEAHFEAVSADELRKLWVTVGRDNDGEGFVLLSHRTRD